MTNSHDEEWMRKEAQGAKERRAGRAPAFGRVWEGARALQHERQCAPSSLASWSALAASLIILFVVISLYRTATTPLRIDPRERDYAAVEGALLTYWQAPSDGWLEEISTEPTSEP